MEGEVNDLWVLVLNATGPWLLVGEGDLAHHIAVSHVALANVVVANSDALGAWFTSEVLEESMAGINLNKIWVEVGNRTVGKKSIAAGVSGDPGEAGGWVGWEVEVEGLALGEGVHLWDRGEDSFLLEVHELLNHWLGEHDGLHFS